MKLILVFFFFLCLTLTILFNILEFFHPIIQCPEEYTDQYVYAQAQAEIQEATLLETITDGFGTIQRIADSLDELVIEEKKQTKERE